MLAKSCLLTLSVLRRMKMMGPLEDEFPPEPPTDWPDQPTILRKPEPHKPRHYKAKLLLVDSSKGVKDSERMIIISDNDGTLVCESLALSIPFVSLIHPSSPSL